MIRLFCNSGNSYGWFLPPSSYTSSIPSSTTSSAATHIRKLSENKAEGQQHETITTTSCDRYGPIATVRTTSARSTPYSAHRPRITSPASPSNYPASDSVSSSMYTNYPSWQNSTAPYWPASTPISIGKFCKTLCSFFFAIKDLYNEDIRCNCELKKP